MAFPSGPCSGCITSAESVLITQQSVDEFLSVIFVPSLHSAASASEDSVQFGNSGSIMSSLATVIPPYKCNYQIKHLSPCTEVVTDRCLQVLDTNQPPDQGGRVIIVSISPQAWASVATKYNIAGARKPLAAACSFDGSSAEAHDSNAPCTHERVR